MAQVILGGAGQAVAGPLGGWVGATLGRMVDQGAVAALGAPRQVGPRLQGLKVQGAAEGEPMAWVAGRARIVGQVIWAARFLERRRERSGGKGGPRTIDYGYSLSFAVALCEGEIDGVGRIWADGRPMDLTGLTWRLHRGGADQTPDPLIEAIEGAAPAYRGVAYVVFEDLALDAFGDRPPQLAFEVFRRPKGEAARLEDRLEGVCLIPGAGEFVLATEAVTRREGLTRTASENRHGGDGRADLVVSLDQLQAQAPNLKRVSLVIGWFGDDVRAAHCSIRPGVERADKPTEPMRWSVAGLERHEARIVSRTPSGPSGHLPHEGGGEAPAYGGTPSDDSVRQAVAELKRRGWAVTLYPFVFMDCEGYPWRGRLAGRDGPEAAADVAQVFGAADGWGLRRLARHYATLAAETGADGLLIGSEMRGLTGTTDGAGGFPAVDQFRALAAECRALVGPDVEISYAADWSEYFGRHDGADVRFHLDPLWADPNIDYVGIDWYPPLGDWRAGDGGRDVEAFEGPDDPAYLAAQVAGGEGFDWFYATDADRAAQARTAIVDTAHGEHWLFRPKDLKGWWSNAHHERPGGTRSAAPTAWVPGMKPIRLTEFGCAAVNRGGNAPNLFQDPKSDESALPPFSTGGRDDRMQRRALEAVLAHYAAAENNPVSAVYGGPMLAGADAWCWDARPWPAFPGRADVWADAGAWAAGHWLNGRLSGEAADVVGELMARASVEGTVGAVAGEVQGYVVDRPMTARAALTPLLAALDLALCERGGGVAAVGREAPATMLRLEALALPDEGGSVTAERRLEAAPGLARVRFIDGEDGYRTGSALARGAGEGGAVDLDLPAVCGEGLARAAAARLLAGGEVERLTVRLGPLEALRLEPGDVVTLEGRDGPLRVERVELDKTPKAVLAPVVADVSVEPGAGPRAEEPQEAGGAPFLRMLDLPGEAGGLTAAVAREPWRPMSVWAGPGADSLTRRGDVERPTTVGVLTAPLTPGSPHRWDTHAALEVRLEGRAPQSRSAGAILAGVGAMAVETTAGWEVLQYRAAQLVGGDVWRLSGLLRGRRGTEAQARAGGGVGALAVMLDDAATLPARADERGLPLVWRAAPEGAPPGGAEAVEVVHVDAGVRDRPWAPCHLKARATAEGVRLDWIARSRTDDRWDGESVASDPLRFRVTAWDGTVARRRWEVEGTQSLYAAADLATDFPDGPGAASALTVEPWGEGWGWGPAARIEPIPV